MSGVRTPVQAGLVGHLKLRALATDGQRRVERLEQRRRIEVDFIGHSVKAGSFQGRFVRGLHRVVGLDGGLAACALDAGVEFRLDGRRVFTANESAMGCTVEDLVQRT